ncbi:MAG: hypothetical protein ABI670_01985 [Chloroflexota bacterium]
MNEKTISRGLSLSLALSLLVPMLAVAPTRAANAAAAQPDNPTVLYHTTFESTTRPWSARTNDRSMQATLKGAKGDNGCDDGGKGYGALQSYPQPTDAAPMAPVDRSQPLPIATWIEAQFTAPYGPIDVNVQWSTRDLKGCPDCQAAVYVGSSPSTAGGQFHNAGGSLNQTWRPLTYNTSLLYGNTGTVYVAIGWFGTGASVALDCINVSMKTHTDYNFSFEGTQELADWQVVGLQGGDGRLNLERGDGGCSAANQVGVGIRGTKHASLSNVIDVTGEPSMKDAPVVMPSRLIQASFPPSVWQFTDVTVSGMAMDENQCASCKPLVYIGTTPLTDPAQMQRMPGSFTTGWQIMKQTATLSTWGVSKIYVAIGWQDPVGGPVRFRSVGYDCLNIHIEHSNILP